MLRTTVVSVCLFLLAGSGTGAQQPATEALIDRAGAYLVDLFPRLTNVVAEEQYQQQIVNPSKKRSLRSDYLLVRLQDTGNLATFRDVFEVDGKPVRDRDERLLKLFVDSPGTALEQAGNIAREGARHNISNIGTISNPFLVMAFLQSEYRPRFRFQAPRLDRSMAPDVWAMQFEEFRSPTILKGDGNRDVFSRGRVWVEQASGRVVKTELLLGPSDVRRGLTPIEVIVSFRYDEALDLLVPTEMREFYPNFRLGDVRGVATYGRFRRFGVTTTESVAP